MRVPAARFRWSRLTPDRLLAGLLAVDVFLAMSERCSWFHFNQHKGWSVLISLASVVAVILLISVWFAISLVLRLRFQYDVRSLLVLILAVAIPSSWLALERERARKQRQVVADIVKLGGIVVYDYHERGLPEPPEPMCLRSILGGDFFSTVRGVRLDTTNITDGELEDLGRLLQLGGLPQLRGLLLSGVQVTDQWLEHLKCLTQLQWLSLVETSITDSGLEHLRGLTELKTLWLSKTKVTDAGLEQLGEMSHLLWLYLDETRVTDEAVTRLKSTLPNCTIYPLPHHLQHQGSSDSPNQHRTPALAIFAL